MAEIFVDQASRFADGDRRIVTSGALEIGVFRWEGQFYAYRNLCAHQGGPACEGVLMHKVEDVLGPDRTFQGQRFSESEIHFVCPWHGVEYDLRTGAAVADPRLRLRSFPVVVRADEVFVVAD